jgi:hypothetical protein
VSGRERAHLRVVAGQPTAEELAALTVALAAAARARAARAAGAAGAAGGARAPVRGWAWRGRLLRSPLAHGPGAWRRSALPG